MSCELLLETLSSKLKTKIYFIIVNESRANYSCSKLMAYSSKLIMKRRNFIKHSAAGIVIPSTIQGMSVKSLGLSGLMSQLLNPYTETDKVLVIVRLAGGNDGLNTVIPLDQYDALTANRSNILIPAAQVLKLNGNTATGLNPALTGVQTLYNEGKIKIVQSVSYPNQSFSHFRATDILMTGADSNKVLTSGWVGRYLTNEFPNFPTGFPNTTMPDPLGIEMNDISVTFGGLSTLMGITVSDPSNPYSFLTDGGTNTGTGKSGTELKFLQQVAVQSDTYGKVVKAAFDKSLSTAATYPNTTLGLELSRVSRFIKGGLKTRVYFVTVGGSFDTHAIQVDPLDHTKGNQANRLGELNDALLTFQRDLEKAGVADRVLTMTFSEFGRRIQSNASGGTDHGAAYPMFIMGTKLNGGVLGTNVQVPTGANVNNNIPMQYDFRSVYGTIMRDWFCTPDSEVKTILLNTYQYLPIVSPNACTTTTATHDANQAAGLNLISAYPNPFDFATTISFTTYGGHTLVQVIDAEGQIIAVPVDGQYIAGDYRVYFNGGYLPNGLYYVRLQNESIQQVKSIVKVQ